MARKIKLKKSRKTGNIEKSRIVLKLENYDFRNFRLITLKEFKKSNNSKKEKKEKKGENLVAFMRKVKIKKKKKNLTLSKSLETSD